MRLVTLLAIAALAAAGCAAQQESQQGEVPMPGGPASADSSALAAVDSAIAGLGGWAGWARARYIAFDWLAQRGPDTLRHTRHQWDRHTGDYRMSGASRDGQRYDVVLDLNTRQGRVRIDGAEPDDSTRAMWLERAYRVWTNDTYWFLMPFKMRDPGVMLTDEGARPAPDGRQWRVVGLAFEDGVGMTSRDRYWVYLDPESYRPGYWQYHLEGMAPEEEPAMATWEGWQQAGPIWVSTMHRPSGSENTIAFTNVTISETVPEGVFE